MVSAFQTEMVIPEIIIPEMIILFWDQVSFRKTDRQVEGPVAGKQLNFVSRTGSAGGTSYQGVNRGIR